MSPAPAAPPEIDALSAITGQDVSRETFDRLGRYAELVREEAGRQNLVSASTLDQFWERHILDSAQLSRFLPVGGMTADIGSGAGLPGIVLACLGHKMTLIEPRRLRADFLARAAQGLGLHVNIVRTRAQGVVGRFAAVTARAVGTVSDVLAMSQDFSTANTRFVLPKGKSAYSELESARRAWHGVFHVEQSLTDPGSGIVIAEGIRRRR
jgi:16S rRNA (guanine527-N7)-methyltransferase